MLRAHLVLLALLALPSMTCGQGPGGVRVGPPFADHMVLPHDVPIVLYGSGCPGGDTVKVAIAGQTAWARSDWQGHWEVPLKPMRPGGPYQLLIEIGGAGPLVPNPAANARGGAEWNDVLIGEVVLASTLETEARAKSRAAEPSSPHPFAFVRVFSAASAAGSQSWSFVAQNFVPARTAALFRLGAERAASLGMPVGVVESERGPLCLSPGSCPTAPKPRPGP